MPLCAERSRNEKAPRVGLGEIDVNTLDFNRLEDSGNRDWAKNWANDVTSDHSILSVNDLANLAEILRNWGEVNPFARLGVLSLIEVDARQTAGTFPVLDRFQ